ncbi:DUF3800 domain-containing protein [Fretibacter rubidus]|uniref:DUF3800 domain-containing protein n=1 Tax=Fretibacter rubidus TaxID=570162 RepID=UPI003529E8BD
MYGRKKYTVFIDESGDSGIEKIRSLNSQGASPYLTLGAILMVTSDFEQHRNTLAIIRTQINKNDLHCAKLRHFQKVLYAKEVAKLNRILCFGVISNKSTLKGYSKQIEFDSTKFYNKCCLYLFEMIGRFLRDTGISMTDIDFVMEEGNFEYQALRNYLRNCRDNPIYEHSKMLGYLDPENIVSVPKSKEELLCYADLVAHSLYKAVDRPASTYGISETRYLKEISAKFLKSKADKKIVGSGIKAIHNLRNLKLETNTEAFFKNLTG